MSNYITQSLTSQWLTSYKSNMLELENYYFGEHRSDMLTNKQQTDPKLARFWNPINLCGLIVEEPIGYLAEGHFNIKSDNEKVAAFGNHFFNKRIKQILPDVITYQGLFNETYIYFYADIEGQNKGLKAKHIPVIQNGQPRVEADFGGSDDEELTAAVIYYRTPSKESFVERKVTLTAESIIVEAREEKSNAWVEETNVSNLTGVIPLIPVFNSGKPDLLDVIPLQDDYNSVMYDLRSARSFHGFPMLAYDGDGVDSGPMSQVEIEITTSDGTEVKRIERRRELEVGAGVYFPKKVKRIEPADLSAILESRNAILEDMATVASSVALMKKSNIDLSGLALRYLQQSFEAKMMGKANQLADAIKRSLEVACRQLSSDSEGTYKHEMEGLQDAPSADELSKAKFIVELKPKFPMDAKENSEVAEKFFNLGGSREGALGMLVRNPAKEIERRREEDAELNEPSDL